MENIARKQKNIRVKIHLWQYPTVVNIPQLKNKLKWTFEFVSELLDF